MGISIWWMYASRLHAQLSYFSFSAWLGCGTGFFCGTCSQDGWVQILTSFLLEPSLQLTFRLLCWKIWLLHDTDEWPTIPQLWLCVDPTWTWNSWTYAEYALDVVNADFSCAWLLIHRTCTGKSILFGLVSFDIGLVYFLLVQLNGSLRYFGLKFNWVL